MAQSRDSDFTLLHVYIQLSWDICWKHWFILTKLSWSESPDGHREELFLYHWPCPIVLCVLCPCPAFSMTVLCSKFWNQNMWVLQLYCSFQIVLANLSFLPVHRGFIIILSISSKRSSGILIGIVLNPWIDFESLVFLTMLSLLTSQRTETIFPFI